MPEDTMMDLIHQDAGEPLNAFITEFEAGKDASVFRTPQLLSLPVAHSNEMSNASRERPTPKPLSFRHLSEEARFREEQDDLMHEIILYPMVHVSPTITNPVSNSREKAVRVLGMTEEEYVTVVDAPGSMLIVSEEVHVPHLLRHLELLARRSPTSPTLLRNVSRLDQCNT